MSNRSVQREFPASTVAKIIRAPSKGKCADMIALATEKCDQQFHKKELFQ